MVRLINNPPEYAMPKTKPLILILCWLAVAIVTGVAIGLYPAFNIKLEPLDGVKELRCKALITKELELIDEFKQVHAGLGFEDNDEPILYMINIPNGSAFYCLPNEITLRKDKTICEFVAKNKGMGTYGLNLYIFDNKPIIGDAIGVNSKGDTCFVLSGENMSPVSGIALVSNNPGMEILQTKDQKQILSINYKPFAGSGIYLRYPDQMLSFPNKKDNSAKPSSIFQSLLGK